MRLFIAFGFSEPSRALLCRYAAALRDLAAGGTYPDSSSYHVTLAFLGECERDRAAAVEAAIRASVRGRDAIPATIGGVGSFDRQDGKIVWTGVSGGDALQELHAALCTELEKRGFVLPDADKRNDYRPHVTLGRNVLVKDADLEKLPDEKGTETLSRVSLMLSARVRGQMRYTELSSFDLG